MQYPIRVGIVGLGRWAKVLTRAAEKSDTIKIVAGYSRFEEFRSLVQAEIENTAKVVKASDLKVE